MPRVAVLGCLIGLSAASGWACSSSGGASTQPPAGADGGTPDAEITADAGPACTGTSAECASAWEQRASDRFDAVVNAPADLAAFAKAMPKGGDLHNHLSGAVYAETYLDWGKADGDCVNSTTFAAVYGNQCSAATQPAPTSGPFFEQILRAWSMKDFVPGAETGHDHFFATFGKYGAIAGAHRDDSIADVLNRAADENQLYVETMFNLGKNVGTLAASVFSGSVTADALPGFYDTLTTNAGFNAQVDADVAAVNSAGAAYKNVLGCNGASPAPGCKVGVRFVAQVSRTGANDTIFGQLVSAYEMAAKTGQIVAVNLSSPEDDTTSLRNYDLHMAMLDFLYAKYTVTKKSPLHVTLHAGELTPQFLPPAYADANTYHVRRAIDAGHAERIGHGIDVLSETDAPKLLADMHARNVLVEVCLSSNAQILEVAGAKHPLGEYLKAGVPVALATDDQGVSRSSLAGEYVRAAVDQKLGYRQLKTMARNSLEHAFLPGDSLWTAVAEGKPVADCAPDAKSAVGDAPSEACKAFLGKSERATMQWELEHRFLDFESKQ